MWWAFGYSVSFAPGSPWIGGFQWSWLSGVNADPNADYGPWVSHNVYAMYQMMFAIITPALIVGAIAERMRFSALMVFCMAWMVIVYFPVTHMMWGVGGWMNGLWNAKAAIRAIDFAGGIVVHMTSGWSALALCLLLGPRRGFGREPIPPHSMVLCMVGTGMLWFGWYGFNAGSAVAADKIAANPPHAVRMTKRLLREGQTADLKNILEMSAAMQSLAHATADNDEAITAFLEKRAPEFKGE